MRVSELRDAFLCVSDKAPTMPVARVADVLRAIGYAPSRADEEKIAAFAGASDVDFDTFVNIVKNVSNVLSGVNDVYSSLLEFSRTSGTGVHTLKDLKYSTSFRATSFQKGRAAQPLIAVLVDCPLGEPLSETEWNALVDAMGVDRNMETPIRATGALLRSPFFSLAHNLLQI